MVSGGRGGGCQIALDRRFDPLLAFAGDFLLLRLAPVHSADEIGPQPGDRLLLPALLDFLRRAIARCIVGGRVIAEPVGDGLDEAWPFSRPGGSDCRIGGGAHRDDVVAVDLLAGKTRRDRLLRQRLRRRLQLERHRDRPLIVVDHEYDGQLPHAGEIHRLPHVTL